MYVCMVQIKKIEIVREVGTSYCVGLSSVIAWSAHLPAVNGAFRHGVLTFLWHCVCVYIFSKFHSPFTKA